MAALQEPDLIDVDDFLLDSKSLLGLLPNGGHRRAPAHETLRRRGPSPIAWGLCGRSCDFGCPDRNSPIHLFRSFTATTASGGWISRRRRSASGTRLGRSFVALRP